MLECARVTPKKFYNKISGAVSQTLEPIAPDAEKMWLRSGATLESTVIDKTNGREETVPIFNDSKIKNIEPVRDAVEVIYKGERVGSKQHYRVEMTTGISRDAIVYMPLPEKQESVQFTVHMDTPWFTGEDGHNDRIAQAFMQYTDQPVIMIGPENMQQHKNGLYIAKNLGRVATESNQISLALAAQDSMQIANELASGEVNGSLELPRKFIQVGESRAAMMAPGKHPYATNLEIQNVYYDITDPCMPDNIRSDSRNFLKIPLFAASLSSDLIPVGIDLARRGSLHRERGTVPTKAEYMGAAILGTGPALMSGESGKFTAYLPDSTPLHLANFKHNPVAYHDRWRELYSHTKFAGVNLRGAHLGLAYSSVQRHVIERINLFITEYERVDGMLEAMDYYRVHMIDDQQFLGPYEHSRQAA